MPKQEKLKRTNVNISRRQYEYLMAVAKRQKKSFSAVLREAIAAHEEHSKLTFRQDPIFEIVGMGKAGKHAARDHDKLLYGKQTPSKA